MKNISVLALASILLFSCSKDPIPYPQKTEQELAFDDLKTRIRSHGYPYMMKSSPETRWWPFKRKRDSVLASDAAGAATGLLLGSLAGPALSGVLGLLFGAGSSLATALTSSEDAVVNTEATIAHEASDVYIYCESATSTEYDAIGAEHNEVIIALADRLIGNGPIDSETLMGVIVDEMTKQGYATDVSATELSPYLNDFNKIYQAVENNADGQDVTKAFIELYPETANEMETLACYFDVCYRIDDEYMVEYSTEVREVVVNSEISEESKNIIRAAISVAVGSRELWVIE